MRKSRSDADGVRVTSPFDDELQVPRAPSWLPDDLRPSEASSSEASKSSPARRRPPAWVVAVPVVLLLAGLGLGRLFAAAPEVGEPVGALDSAEASTAPTPSASLPAPASPSAAEGMPSSSPSPEADSLDPSLGAEPVDPEGAGPPTASDEEPAGLSALEALELLEVKGRAPMTGYDRELFAYRSVDLDRNGCDVRNDILRRDLLEVRIRAGTQDCVVESGVLIDPYSGDEIKFERGWGTSSEVQIDHVVAMADAWQKGAQSWPEKKLHAFGNDPLNLLAASGPLNQSKGAGDAATWLPPNKGFRCEYVARQVSVKLAYGLWVTTAEKAAIARVLERCAPMPLLESEFASSRSSP